MPPAIDALRALLAALAIAVPAPGSTGALSFVNATGLPEKIDIRVDGEPLSRDGYPHGEFSGGLLFPAGRAIRIEASAPCAEPAPAFRVVPGEGTTQVIVIYAMAQERPTVPTLALRARVLPHKESSARHSITGVYLGAQPFVVIRSNGRDVKLPPDVPAEIWKGDGAAFTVAMPHGAVQVRLDEPGHYWLILHDRGGGPTGHLLIPDPAYSAPIFDAPASTGR
ncbi:MAG TPA: hypothetical protein PLU30_03015 [Verrucomicrobiae bacterium]|nr:hypothetical protein [Verrucomicrobiae bacterium]